MARSVGGERAASESAGFSSPQREARVSWLCFPEYELEPGLAHLATRKCRPWKATRKQACGPLWSARGCNRDRLTIGASLFCRIWQDPLTDVREQANRLHVLEYATGNAHWFSCFLRGNGPLRCADQPVDIHARGYTVMVSFKVFTSCSPNSS
jgi:hypothetical protein